VEKVSIGQETAHTLGARSLGGYEHFFTCVVIVPPDVCEPYAVFVICGGGFLRSREQGLAFVAVVDAEIIRVIGGKQD
jgi:hypothetical protein